MFELVEVDGITRAADLRRLNGMWPADFLPLTDQHLEHGFWWIARDKRDGEEVGFAGMVSFEPFTNYCYLKRAAVLPKARGRGLQRLAMEVREAKARLLSYTHMISECEAVNVHSANNFIGCGYKMFTPERPWASTPSLYWIKRL